RDAGCGGGNSLAIALSVVPVEAFCHPGVREKDQRYLGSRVRSVFQVPNVETGKATFGYRNGHVIANRNFCQ
ncbi:MAG: hypothetical protein ACR2Q4_17210, partial [Geminicoccaceae bacterium]